MVIPTDNSVCNPYADIALQFPASNKSVRLTTFRNVAASVFWNEVEQKY